MWFNSCKDQTPSLHPSGSWGVMDTLLAATAMSHSPLIGSMWRWNRHHNFKTMTTVNHIDWQVAAASVSLQPSGWQELPSAPGEVRQLLHVRPSVWIDRRGGPRGAGGDVAGRWPVCAHCRFMAGQHPREGVCTVNAALQHVLLHSLRWRVKCLCEMWQKCESKMSIGIKTDDSSLSLLQSTLQWGLCGTGLGYWHPRLPHHPHPEVWLLTLCYGPMTMCT